MILSWLLGCVIVRVGLDWADTFPYSPASERRYLLVAVIALAVAFGGTAAALLVRRRRGPDQSGGSVTWKAAP